MKYAILGLICFSNLWTLASAQALDPLFSKQWALKNSGQVILKNINDLERVSIKGIPGIDINWVDTEEKTTSKKELIVAVLDSGLDLDHPDLKGRVWYNQALCAGATNTANRACYGFNYLDNNALLTDDIGHGTHVAGLIAANRNSIGISGAADSRVKIMPLKVLNNQVNGFVYNGKVITDVIADAMIFAIKNGAEVINLSLGWPKLIDLEKVRQAFEMAEKNQVIVIAASGNNNKDLPTFPCGYENVICVGAIDNRGELTDFTNHGSKVDLVAPGESIISTYPKNIESRVLRIKNYESKRGSSQASPYVAAAVANLKLLYPGLSNDQVKSLLFRSTRKIDNKNAGRFVKYGMLDMGGLLSLAEKELTQNRPTENGFVIPLLKNLTEVKFNTSDLSFSFNLSLKNLSQHSFSGPVCVETESTAIAFNQNCVNMNSLSPGAFKDLIFEGRIQDLSHDSHITLRLQMGDRAYSTSVVLIRDLNNDSEVISRPLGAVSFDDMGVINGDRKLSRMIRVFDKHKRLLFPEYFYLERLKQTASSTIISLLTEENNKFIVKTLALPKVNRVLSVHRQDINLDGSLDYFIYTLSEKRDELQFYFFNNKLEPLFTDHSVWTLPLTAFEGLPIEGGAEKFEWIKLEHQSLGNIVVPSIYRTYSMPEADNSKIISERVLGSKPHQFYLNPIVQGKKVQLELRVLDSTDVLKALQSQLNVRGQFDTKTIYLLKPFPQTESESTKGHLRSLLLLEEEGVSQYFEIKFTQAGKRYTELTALKSDSGIGQSLIYPILDSSSGEVTKGAVFTTLLNRSSAEFLVKNESSIESPLRLNDQWENPIIALTSAFELEGAKSFLIESRSTMTMLRENGDQLSLPIYRDSSFPGQSFSETMTPIFSLGRPGVYINSTLIYGDRLYSMIDTQKSGFIRPIALSVGIPSGCLPLSPEIWSEKNKYHYAFLCIDSKRETSLKFLPMSHL